MNIKVNLVHKQGKLVNRKLKPMEKLMNMKGNWVNRRVKLVYMKVK